MISMYAYDTGWPGSFQWNNNTDQVYLFFTQNAVGVNPTVLKLLINF
jgi:hypothetical protein